MNIIVVEDDISINDILTSALRYEGYSVRSAFTSSQGKDLLESFKPDLILLDINLPDESGYEICKLVTNKSLKIPVIMLTARNDIIDKILGLEMGADDYITKPFNIKEVLTRVKVALRRVDKYKKIEQEVISEIQLKNNISIKSTSRSVFKNDIEVRLKPKEYDLLEYLVNNRGRVFSRELLLDKVWGDFYDGDVRTVDVHVRRLRSKLDAEGECSLIETIFGVGYVMR